MCGIAGLYGIYNKDIVKTMLKAQKKRGPDGEGIWADEEYKITLGHVRLSIIDVTNSGHQPMHYLNDRFTITYNGEIYNYNELKESLLLHGFNFSSNSDTEVILAAYAHWGSSCLDRFRGMFSFVIFDKFPKNGQPSLFCARDRLGIKPFLYADLGNIFVFGSQLNSILASNLVKSKINESVVNEYFMYGSISQPNTIINDIKHLPAGNFIEIYNDGNMKIKSYWDLEKNTIELRQNLKNITKSKAIEELRLKLNEATELSLVSDVSVGAFLSGGIDSTAVVGLMNSQVKNKIKTYSIGFENIFSEIDERKFAKIAADFFETEHYDEVFDVNQSEQIFDEIINDIDQPSIDGTNTWIVSRLASNKSKVVLSGIGGDELFGGYPHFFSFSKNKFNFFKFIKPLINKIHSLRPNFITNSIIYNLSNDSEKLNSLRILYTEDETEKFLNSKYKPVKHNRTNFFDTNLDRMQKLSSFEINGYLKNTLLRDSDVMSMSHSLELRPILLDHPLVEYVFSLPEKLKLEANSPKKLFVDSVSEFIPKSLRKRKKLGFEMPFVSWMNGPLNDRFIKIFNSDFALNILSEKFRRKIISQIKRKKCNRRLWAVGVFLCWLEKNSIEL